MTFSDIVMRMFPYWIMGFIMLYAVWNSKHRELLRVSWPALKKFTKIMVLLTVYRAVIFHFFGDQPLLKDQASGAMMIPWQSALTVFWEDACHGMPLVLLSRWLEGKKWAKWINRAAMAFVMVSFGLGHVYQGWFAAAFLSLYIPFSMKMGEKHGFGTVMIGHSFYDLITILTLQFFLG